VAAVARELGRSWDTVNAIAVEATRELLLTTGPARLKGVEVIGVDEHKWAHTRGAQADGFVTVITDLTPVVAGHGPARLLDMVPGRSAAAMTDWLEARSQAFRDRVQIVAMDGFGGYKNAATTALPDAVTVARSTSSPWPGTSSTCAASASSRTPSDTLGHLGHRGRTGDPLYRVRRTLRTRLGLLTDRQRARLETVFAAEEHVAVEVTWWAYQQIIAAYADENPTRGRTLLTAAIDRLRTGLPAGLDELATLGRTLHRRRDDVLAYFDHRASNGPTEAINGRLEALRRNALGFRNMVNYRIRSLLHCGSLAL
jgi:transposase